MLHLRALCLPTSFPISGLARLGSKTKTADPPGEILRPLSRPCFLLGRLSLLALPPLVTPLPLLCNPLFPLHGPAQISLFLANVRLSLTLTLSHFTIWCFGLRALFLYLLAKAALAYLLTALSLTPRPLFPSHQAQYLEVSPLKPAPFCKLFAGLGSTNKSATCFLSFGFDSRSVLAVLSSLSSCLLPAETVFSLLLFYQATMNTQTLVSPRKRHG